MRRKRVSRRVGCLALSLSPVVLFMFLIWQSHTSDPPKPAAEYFEPEFDGFENVTLAPGSVVLFSNGRDEPHFAEWCVHHLLLGFDHLVVLDHLSTVPFTPPPGPLGSRVTIVRTPPWVRKGKHVLPARRCALRNQLAWFLYLDQDEFLALPGQKTVSQLLSNIRDLHSDSWDNIGEVILHWYIFGSGNLDVAPRDTLLMETYTRAAPDFLPGGYQSFTNTKSLARPALLMPDEQHHGRHTVVAHYWLLKPHGVSVLPDGRACVVIDGTRFGTFVDSKRVRVIERREFEMWRSRAFWNDNCFDQPTCFFSCLPDKLPLQSTAFVAHYEDQAWETYKARKCDRVRDDIPVLRDCSTREEVHSRNNDIEMTFLKDAYAGRVREYLAEHQRN